MADEALRGLAIDVPTARAADKASVRWDCQKVFAATGDARAAALLAQLHADVQAELAELADPAERERLVQDHAFYGDIVAACRAADGHAATGG